MGNAKKIKVFVTNPEVWYNTLECATEVSNAIMSEFITENKIKQKDIISVEHNVNRNHVKIFKITAEAYLSNVKDFERRYKYSVECILTYYGK